MKALHAVVFRYTALALALLLLLPPAASAKPLDAAAVRDRIAKRGVGTWLCIEERSGIELIGRVTSIDQDSFGMQLQNYPDVTPVNYNDVTRIRFGPSRGAAFAIIGVAVGSAVIAAVVMHHEFEANKPQLPTTPSTPVFP
jgi:hypothetical protein